MSTGPTFATARCPSMGPGKAARVRPILGNAAPHMRHILHGTRIQTKLTVGAANDPAEHEADRVADEVMRMPDNGAVSPLLLPTAAPPAIRRKCDACAEEDTVRRRADGQDGGGPAPASVREVLRSSGRPLDAASRAFFEPRFGYDFSSVRIHTDSAAAQSAQDIGALAYTLGRDIAFAAGQFAPYTAQGRHLMAHELAHTVQQSGAPTTASSQVIQRACGEKQIGDVKLKSEGLEKGSGGADINGVLIRFRVGCDEFLTPDDGASLENLASICPRGAASSFTDSRAKRASPISTKSCPARAPSRSGTSCPV
jgi:hypothetical protein